MLCGGLIKPGWQALANSPVSSQRLRGASTSPAQATDWSANWIRSHSTQPGARMRCRWLGSRVLGRGATLLLRQTSAPRDLRSSMLKGSVETAVRLEASTAGVIKAGSLSALSCRGNACCLLCRSLLKRPKHSATRTGTCSPSAASRQWAGPSPGSQTARLDLGSLAATVTIRQDAHRLQLASGAGHGLRRDCSSCRWHDASSC